MSSESAFGPKGSQAVCNCFQLWFTLPHTLMRLQYGQYGVLPYSLTPPSLSVSLSLELCLTFGSRVLWLSRWSSALSPASSFVSEVNAPEPDAPLPWETWHQICTGNIISHRDSSTGCYGNPLQLMMGLRLVGAFLSGLNY